MTEQILLSGITPIELQKLIVSGVKEELEKQFKKTEITEQKQQGYLSIKEACEYLKCSETKLWRIRKAGKLGSRKFGRNKLIKLQDIEDLLSNLDVQKGGQNDWLL